MNQLSFPRPDDSNVAEVSALIDTLHKTEQRIEQLTAGEVDSVADNEGLPFLCGKRVSIRHCSKLN